jgi:hypothetical protein
MVWPVPLSLANTHGISLPAGRLISTGQLRQSLVLPSTSGLSTRWSSREPLGDEPRGNG